MKDELSAAAKVTPAGIGTYLSSVTLNEWIMVATLVYVCLQIGLLLPKYWGGLRRLFAPAAALPAPACETPACETPACETPACETGEE